jgi:hypothetical protein
MRSPTSRRASSTAGAVSGKTGNASMRRSTSRRTASGSGLGSSFPAHAPPDSGRTCAGSAAVPARFRRVFTLSYGAFAPRRARRAVFSRSFCMSDAVELILRTSSVGAFLSSPKRSEDMATWQMRRATLIPYRDLRCGGRPERWAAS